MFPRQIFYCQYWPEGHFADICSYGWNITQQEDRRQEQGKPDDVAIDLFDGHKHHGVQITVAHKMITGRICSYP